MQSALDEPFVLGLYGHLSVLNCAMLLGDLGVDAIKMERPGEGDEARQMPPFVNGESKSLMLANRNKLSTTLDLEIVAEVEYPRAWRTNTRGATIKLSDTLASIRRPSPLHGEHSAGVLSDFEERRGVTLQAGRGLEA